MDEYLPTDEYLKLYETQTEYDAEKDNLQLPNVSLVIENNTVYYNPDDEPEVPVISGTDTFTGSTQVTISCETVGATIYYTTDGSNPTLNSAVYTEPITLSATTTVKAISAKANVKSEAVSKGFTLLVAPVISGSEIFTGSTQVTLSCETAGATIYYTTDGSTPTTESTEYESAITLSADATVKAISAKNGVSSSVTSKAFSVLEVPIISGNTKFEDTTEVTITCDTVGSSIYYTLDGTTPTTSSAEYTAEITLSATTTVKAIAVVGAMSSTVASQTFSILDYSREYLTIASTADNNTIGWKASSSSLLKTISISTDNGQTWTNKTSSTTTSGTTLATLNNGDKLLIKGSNMVYATISKYSYFTSTQNFDVSGNIMSLLYGDNFIGETSLSGKSYAFNNLFYNNTKLVNAQNLKLPATTLASSCYGNMFYNCKALTTAPTLPATTLATWCYGDMFRGCTSLTTAPVLPATTLAESCYYGMFKGCTGLTTAPSLPATKLATQCYYEMFSNCTSLATAHTLPSTVLTSDCYHSMFSGCMSLTTAPELPATTLALHCYESMFSGCTSLTIAPELPATTLASDCYHSMFDGCTSLTTAPELPAIRLAYSCYYSMFQGCTSLTTAPVLSATTLATYCYSSMFNGCTSLATAPELPATTLATWCYANMFNGCIGLTTAPALPATTLASSCYFGMFFGCTSLTTAPELPATTLASSCYRYMFMSCTSLNYIKCLATDISATDCTSDWVYNVAALGTFVKDPNMSGWTIGANGIPSGWTVEDYHDYSNDYLTIVSSADNNTIGWKATGKSNLKTISVSIDDGQTWTDKTSSKTSSTTLATLNNGDKLLIKGSNAAYGTNSYYNYFTSTQNFDVEGNIMSLLYGDNFIGQTSLNEKSFVFNYLFYGNTYLINAQNLELPATTLADYCYDRMFCGCTSLTTAPVLPATTLANYCYEHMFNGCTALTTAPALPATTLTTFGYAYMFDGCTSLTTAPALPATTLAIYCYSQMFNGCTALTTAPALPATTLSQRCYAFMFDGCTSLTTAPTLSATTLADNCYTGMFSNCTALTTAPALPATTLETWCYSSMFKNCTSLTTTPEILPATTLLTGCYYGMFRGCSSLTTAPALPATTPVANCYSHMFYDCTSLNYIKCLATSISATDCTTDWVTNVAATGTFMKDENMTSWIMGNNGIPTGWSIIDKYETEYLTIVSTADNNTIGWKASSSSNLKTISISADDGQTWTDKESSTSGTTLATLNNGDKLLIKGSNTAYGTYYYYNYFTSTQNFDVEGNIMSLLYGDNFIGQTSLTGKDYAFKYLFYNYNKLVNAQNLKLPATTLAGYCYDSMFHNCTSLITAPELPATTLAHGCYETMFDSCTSLTTAPALPATTLVNDCYRMMFNNCPSLTTAPELRATTLASCCYYKMFYGCTHLNYIKCLATDISATDCTSNWVSNVAATGIFVKHPSMTSWTTGVNGIPTNWTVEDNNMYNDEYLTIVSGADNNTIGWKTSDDIFNIKTISVSIDGGQTWIDKKSSATGTTLGTLNNGDKLLIKGGNMVYGTSDSHNYFTSTQNFDVEGNIMSLLYGDNFIGETSLSGKTYAFYGLFKNNTYLVNAENLILPSTTLASDCYASMFYGCSSLTTAPTLPATTLASTCYSNMFGGCTSLTTAPELPATTLASECYNSMFRYCSSLNYIKCLATNISATNCTSDWVYNVAASGTFVKNPNMSGWTIGANGIPSGWTVEDYHDYSNDYLTIVSTADNNTIGWKVYDTPAASKTISVSTDDGQTWTDKESSTDGTTLATLNNGDKLLIKGNNTAYAGFYNRILCDNYFTSTQNFDVEGNIMSLLYGDNFIGETSLSGNTCAFTSLFVNNTYLVNAENLILPATTLARDCYDRMFAGCISLTTAPELPATTLAVVCYQGMFRGCTSLTTAPTLPATTLAEDCYNNMFSGCTSLTTAPELPATTLTTRCYKQMFAGCTSLNYIKCLATDISATECTNYWANRVSATGTFVKDPSMTSWTTGISGIPTNWTVQDAS